MALQVIVKTWVSLASVRIHYRGAKKTNQEVFEIIHKRANDLGQGGSSRNGEKSSDQGYFLKGELTVVADGPRYKTKRGIKFASLV